jgi:hypothetical protein
MSSNPARLASIITSTALAVLTATHARAADSRVVVRVYDIGNTAADVRAAAIRRAAAIMLDASVSLEWHDCTSPDDMPACTNSPGNWNLIVRILPAFVPGASARSAVRARGRFVDADSPLGFAVVAPEAHADAMATIFDDHVQMVSRRTGVERSELLGRALAHEIGHLLLRAPGHSRTGLMRAVWTDGELTQNHHEDWVFAQADRRRLQLNLLQP